MVVGGCLGHRDHEIIKFSMFCERRRGINKTSTLELGGADFGLFRMLIWGAPNQVLIFLREAGLKTKGAREEGHT